MQKRTINTEFNERLQQLRKHRGLTQEALAEALYVSRTAISKWESGRGYPSIDSLKAIASYFSVTIDELLSGDEVLIVAEEDCKQTKNHFLDLIFGLFDCSVVMFLFLPLFGQPAEEGIQSVPLLQLSRIGMHLKAAYAGVIALLCICGVLTLALQNTNHPFWLQNKRLLSVAVHAAGVLLFIISPQPYAAAVLFLFLLIKAFLLFKRP